MVDFNKIGCFTDIHFGKKGDSVEHNNNCLAFVEWFIAECKSRDCDRICFLGDWHDTRSKIGVQTLGASERAASLLASSGMKVDWILGNHDIFFKDNREVHSLPFLRQHPNINVIDAPQLEGSTMMVPWLTSSDDRVEIASKASKAKYIFGHFELPGFLMTGSYKMPEVSGKLTAEEVSGCADYLFSGHFHARQFEKRGNTEVIYIGNAFPHDFSDAGDTDRGAMFLEWGGEPEFVSWPNQPSYFKVLASEIVEGTAIFPDGASIRIIPDIDMDKEEAEAVRGVASDMGASGATLEPKAPTEPEDSPDWVPESSGIDDLVLSWIQSSDDIPKGIDRNDLARIYLG